MINNVCVFCGSNKPKNDTFFEKEAIRLAKMLYEKKIKLIYGGAKIGIMGIISNELIKRGGEVIGIIHKFLTSKEIVNRKLTELIIVNSMHERKKKMYDLADAFIILPGGIGTLEELSEIITWKVLGIKKKEIFLININGFYNNLLKQFEIMEKHNFLYSNIFEEIKVINESEDLKHKI